MIDVIHKFYCSKEYRELSFWLKVKSGGICEDCGRVFDIPDLRTHHIEELTLANIGDRNITLNANNIKVVCHDCHNRVHRRFGMEGKRQVYLVWGAPCSGKTTYVSQVATRHDLIVEIDRLHKAISNYEFYDRPDDTKAEMFAMRDLLMERIKYRAGRWENAYIVGSYPDRTIREQIQREYGAELIHIDTDKEECLRRAENDEDRLPIVQTVKGWIEDYFRRLTV